MPTVNRLADFQNDIAAWRRDLHQHPELRYEVHRTAGKVAAYLKEFGVDEIATGIGRTGVVGVIRGRKTASGKVIGLRADMDALPITETTGKEYASVNPGMMHACGHDGHTAMLLGAARYLAETRNFDGTAVVIFQPAEEGGAGGKAMVDDGLMERFAIEEVYGMHNLPGMPIGSFGIRHGAMLASTDEFTVEVIGRGSHAAQPHRGTDPLVAAAAMVTALQTISSRTVDPLESAVVSVTRIKIGETSNVIAERGEFAGTIRTLKAEVRDLVEKRFREVVTGIATAHGVESRIRYHRNYPVTRNHRAPTDFAAAVAAEISGDERVDTDMAPLMGGEDFSYMLEARPGAFIFVGNGDTAGLHNPGYDFNDDAIPSGASYWVRLIERAMPAG